MARHSLPSPDAQSSAIEKLTNFLTALESHPSWKPVSRNETATPSHRTLFFLWDFANRSRYILSELENIKEGKQVAHPEQIPKQEGDPKQRAEACFADVVSRSVMVEKLVTTPAVLPSMGVEAVDFGDDVKRAAKEVNVALKG
ncbi:hypothetical protein NLU13_6152 [Sarocladium strictum]|uniref:Uncharacterized protein n=1 Tax=Sarocladium strictum TaxID=5046 RepID=A0AA39L705_SARSR|nr:hypothetical protein NLU13_6152 [Sarocladium strictum]